MNNEFSAEGVALQVLTQLERRRSAIAGYSAADRVEIAAEVERALEPIAAAYSEAELPAPYFARLRDEIVRYLPDAWRAIAVPFTKDEARRFGIWRGGDPVARVTYVFIGLIIGGLCVEAPFIPIFEKWFPFLLAALSWWLPDAQLRWHRRRYAAALGALALHMGEVQPLLDGTITTESLLLDNGRGGST